MAAYYNEIDPYAAQWLRNLITAGHIAPGIVDQRSIEDVRPSDLAGFAQCHFFAGIGVWSLALRRSRWEDDRPVWTGSCPCQPFSQAGQGAGFDDERHLWPAWHHLIEQCRPATILGEQVASKDIDPWIDLVQDDLEAVDYAFGAVPFPSAGIGAPHIRDRLYWVAYAQVGGRREERKDAGWRAARDRTQGIASGSLPGGASGRMANAASDGRRSEWTDGDASHGIEAVRAGQEESGRCGAVGGAGPTNGHWRDADWLLCRDGKLRPVEPGTFPLAHGTPARVGRLRAYGNAINSQAAQVFIESVMECLP